MRGIGLLVVATTLASFALAGCSGADAQRAQELLQQSDQALTELRSYRFAGRFWIESDAGDFTLVMRGGGNMRGGGSSFVTVRSDDIPGFPELTVVQQGRRMWLRAGGAWTKGEAPTGQPAGLDQFDLGQYVKDVSVDEDATVGGEPAVKVTGLLDTTSMFESLFASLGGTSAAGALPFDQVANSFGDTRVVLYLSRTTHLPLRSLVDMSIDVEGEKIALHMDFALAAAKRQVRIPVPTA